MNYFQVKTQSPWGFEAGLSQNQQKLKGKLENYGSVLAYFVCRRDDRQSYSLSRQLTQMSVIKTV